MNKEQLRKELYETAWAAWKSAANAFRLYPDNKHTFSDYWANLGEADATTRLAALDDGDGIDLVKLQDKFDKFFAEETEESFNEWLKMKGYLKSPFYCQSDIEDRGICSNQCDHCKEYYKPLEQPTTKPVDDGQEGKGLHWAIQLRKLLLVPGTHENNAFVRDVTGELETRFPNVNIKIGAALPVADK